jgi:hypothetical protein
MTAKADFTPEEWKLLLEGPPSAAMLVITAQRGGTFRETFSIGKAYAEARQHHGASELLDDIVAAKPEVDRTRSHSPQELSEHVLGQLREAAALLRSKASEQELADYRGFVAGLCDRVARAHSEGADPVSDAERSAIQAVEGALA